MGSGINAIRRAEDEARKLGHSSLSTELILLGLLAEDKCVAAQALNSMGITLDSARFEVEMLIGIGSGELGQEIPFTPEAKRVLELSWDEARQLGHKFMSTGHLLLGIIRKGDGKAIVVLGKMGVDLTALRSKVISLTNERGSEGGSSSCE